MRSGALRGLSAKRRLNALHETVTTCKDFAEMLEHVGHRLLMVSYGTLQGQETEVSIECMTCDEVLFSQKEAERAA